MTKESMDTVFSEMPEFVRLHLASYDLTEYAVSIVSADSDEVGSF